MHNDTDWQCVLVVTYACRPPLSQFRCDYIVCFVASEQQRKTLRSALSDVLQIFLADPAADSGLDQRRGRLHHGWGKQRERLSLRKCGKGCPVTLEDQTDLDSRVAVVEGKSLLLQTAELWIQNVHLSRRPPEDHHHP